MNESNGENEVAAIEAALARAKRKLVKVRQDLAALEESIVKSPGEVEALEKRRRKLAQEEAAVAFRIRVLTQSLRQAEERDRLARRKEEERVREKLRPEVEAALEEVRKAATQFGKSYKKLLHLARQLPKVDRLPGPVAAIAMAAIVQQHQGGPEDALDVDCQRLCRLAGFSGKTTVEGEIRAVKGLLLGGEEK